LALAEPVPFTLAKRMTMSFTLQAFIILFWLSWSRYIETSSCPTRKWDTFLRKGRSGDKRLHLLPSHVAWVAGWIHRGPAFRCWQQRATVALIHPLLRLL